jgi:hypothetical protein
VARRHAGRPRAIRRVPHVGEVAGIPAVETWWALSQPLRGQVFDEPIRERVTGQDAGELRCRTLVDQRLLFVLGLDVAVERREPWES